MSDEERRQIEEETARKIADWLSQPTGTPAVDHDTRWYAKLIIRGDWRRDRSNDA